ncbi:PPE domain-containing protein [Mycobacterium leprae]|uniref:PPE domain-containing protein n=1 Tax=Mycobacterium leprae TaxID=1769 RepID=UPI003F66E1DD
MQPGETGPSAERFVTAHRPFFCSWPTASAVAIAEAVGHELASTGYTSASNGIPTLTALAANHA